MYVLSKSSVSFPGLGIDEFSLDNVAFKLGDDFSVYWYGVIITCGIVFAFLYAAFRGKYEGVTMDDLLDITIVTVLVGVVGARLYYVLTSLDQYIPEPFHFVEFIKNVLNVRGGGLAIYGGIIGGALAIVLVTKIKNINTLKLLDMAAPGVMIAQAIGRWGNFFNGEAFGSIVSEGHPLYFLRMGLASYNTASDFGTAEMVYVHPTFLYESLWNIAGFVLINFFYKKKKFNGQVACMYLAWYGFGRMFIEGLRTDSLYIPGTAIRISQLVGLLCFVIFGGLLVAGFIYSKKYRRAEFKMNVADKYLFPSMILNPAFFTTIETKIEKKFAKSNKKKLKAMAKQEEAKGKNDGEIKETNTEDNANGTDH